MNTARRRRAVAAARVLVRRDALDAELGRARPRDGARLGDVRGLQLLAQPIGRRFGLDPDRVVGLHAQHEVHAALQIETETDLLLRRIERADRQRDDADDDEELPTQILRHGSTYAFDRVDDRILALVADDGVPRDLDATFWAICSCTDCSFIFVIEPKMPPEVTTRSPTFSALRNSCTFFCRCFIGSRMTK